MLHSSLPLNSILIRRCPSFYSQPVVKRIGGANTHNMLLKIVEGRNLYVCRNSITSSSYSQKYDQNV